MGTAEELRDEQAHIDRAYARLDELRENAQTRAVEALATSTKGGLAADKIDRDALVHASLRRKAALQIGDQSLCFGRLDTAAPETFHIGRLSVSDAEGDPLIVDWRAPAAEAFYRATSREPNGVVRRRHLRMDGRHVIGIDDELLDRAAVNDTGVELIGEAALLAALTKARTGQMGDIVATIQGDQDRAIRAPLAGVLVVQGGPGTGKTAVALHRAAYLLYEHHFPLATQGVLVVGPNPVFCRYVENVLPGLGETGVRLATPGQLVAGVVVSAVDPAEAAALKGSAAMVDRVAEAIARHHRPLGAAVTIGYGAFRLTVTREDSAALIGAAAGESTYRGGRRAIERGVLKHLARQVREAAGRSARVGMVGPEAARVDLRTAVERLRRSPDVIALLRRLWPPLTPADVVDAVIADLGIPAREERSEHDAALLDEAAVQLGPPPAARHRTRQRRTLDFALDRTLAEMGLLPHCPFCSAELSLVEGEWQCETDGCRRRWRADQVLSQADRRRLDETIDRITATHGEGPVVADRADTFGHAVVDEAQDLTPMQWRVVRRRVPSGSLTLVGDLGQSKYPWAAESWETVAEHVAPGVDMRLLELAVNYRTPQEIMELAAAVLRAAKPTLAPPRSVRRSGIEPVDVRVPAATVLARAREVAAQEALAVDGGTVAIIVPPDLAVPAGPEVLSQTIAELGVDDAKGLEFDSVVVVEPAAFDLGALYVALTRSTSRLVFVRALPLPDVLDTV